MSNGLCLAVAMTALMAFGGSAFAAGDADKGKAAFAAKYGICHQVGPGAKTLVGPELNSIVGRKPASYAEYTMYSAGMKKLGKIGLGLDRGKYRQVDHRSQGDESRSTMALAFQGIPDANERAEII